MRVIARSSPIGATFHRVEEGKKEKKEGNEQE